MRLPDDLGLKLTAIALGFAVASCAPFERAASNPASQLPEPAYPSSGPADDYPVVIGDSFTIDGITYTPTDTLNYDEVGYATRDEDAEGISVAHRTLPLPSYVEVTSLKTGRTILARVERRGPMTNARLLALSPMALAQLGGDEGTAIRVRRVVPPEAERAELRADREAPLRMDTPPGLVDVLRRKLPSIGSAPVRDEAKPDGEDGRATALSTAELGPSGELSETEADSGQSSDQAAPIREPKKGDWIVQAGAFSAQETAQRIALEIEGYVEPTGRLWRVRSGPYASRGQAEAALANVRRAGYRGAQIYRLR